MGRVAGAVVAEVDRSTSLRWHYANRERRNALARARYHDNREANQAKQKAWRDAHPENKKAWIAAHPEEVRRYDRAARLKSAYGLTLGDYDKMLSEQSGVCAVCASPPSGRPLHVDHDHTDGRIRGLLCASSTQRWARRKTTRNV